MQTSSDYSDVYLRKRGIKASFQRVSILDFLQGTTTHPSVSQIFEVLHPKIPNLSRATVYNTINLFLDKRIITPVQVDGPEARYDLAEPQHAHFHCQICQKIFDIPTAEIPIPDVLKEFEVREAQLLYRGVCQDCRSRSTKG